MNDFEYGSDEHLDGLSRVALKSEVRWWCGRAEEMEAENAKLRELVRYAIRCAAGEVDCGACPYGELLRCGGATCKVETAARELGVEVDA